MSFEADPAGRPWIFTADEDDGCSIYWPCKGQWRDEPQDGMDISVSVPEGLMDVSNGRFVSKVPLKGEDAGYNQWNWHVSYPINSYDVALNIAAYTHFSDTYTSNQYPPLTLDYYCLPEDLDKAKVTFPQSKDMLAAFEHYFGEYPFARDGYKLVQVPYSGMEHQSAVAYGNGFKNGYFGDWTGVGISTKFDFIIIHESGHEWFGNAVSAADRADMWIHEGWDTYLESLFVEYQYGHADALTYLNGTPGNDWDPSSGTPHHWNGVRSHVATHNRLPIIPERGVGIDPPQDMYFKGAMMLNTLRSIVADDPKWVHRHQGLLPNLQVQKHHDRRRHRLVEPAHRHQSNDVLQSIPAPRPNPLLGTELRPRHPHRPLQMASGRTRLHHAHPGRRPCPLPNPPPYPRVAIPSDHPHSRPIPGRHRPLTTSTSAKPNDPAPPPWLPHVSILRHGSR